MLNLMAGQEEKEKIKRQIVWAHVLRTVYFIVAYEDDTVQYSSVEATDRPVSLSLQCLCSLAPRNQCFCIYILRAGGALGSNAFRVRV